MPIRQYWLSAVGQTSPYTVKQAVHHLKRWGNLGNRQEEGRASPDRFDASQKAVGDKLLAIQKPVSDLMGSLW